MKLLLHTKKLILPALLLVAGFCVSQNSLLDSLSDNFNKFSVEESRQLLKKIDTTELESYDKALWYFYSGLNYRKNDQHDLGFNDLLIAEKKFSSLDSLKEAADTNYELHILLSHQNDLEIDSKSYLNKYSEYAKSQKDTLKLARAYSRIASDYMNSDDFYNSKFYYEKTLEQLRLIKDTFRIAAVEMNVGTLYYSVKKDVDSALYFYEKTLPVFVDKQHSILISNNYNNQAKAYELKGEPKKAVLFLEKALSLVNESNKKTRLLYYDNIIRNLEKTKDYKKLISYYQKWKTLNDSINDIAQNINIADISEKYKTAELRANQAKTNTYLTIALALLALVIISAYLLQKNTRKKQLLAEQAKDLEAQKVENLLQEQELASIDAMIEGQEKERKRIAEDLHDDLGALMATINLHLENVGSENSPNALSKTKSLLAEAYDKIRNLSHVKNAGVIANEGLLVAVKNMASKISSANKIDIEVIAHGLENRLENSLELSLFRTIQELITNCIKHAEATKATIQLTQFENSLNIIVEDNGKGFDTHTIKEKGIGLNNIKKRIQHLEGTFTIDSTVGKGTTIILDIQIK
ncbi:hypothetical protein C8N46_109132 [Kordia periserrulae]|uniref:histidine kinase n=1 Tax=Kordia periserrulae TaxID=701523 RepID=A0A2T6BU05_9FLAO|nr:sensor histidine kinase [Kordia periserrulae]PTX59543.1 hypothetical protein C8N46_109132 [Kordia periserrulae]